MMIVCVSPCTPQEGIIQNVSVVKINCVTQWRNQLKTKNSKLKIDPSYYGLASRTNKNSKNFIPRGKVENRGETVFFGKDVEGIGYTTAAPALERKKSRPEGEGNISICKIVIYILFLQTA